jgi:hypothetical protein
LAISLSYITPTGQEHFNGQTTSKPGSAHSNGCSSWFSRAPNEPLRRALLPSDLQDVGALSSGGGGGGGSSSSPGVHTHPLASPPRSPGYGDAKVANRETKVWHGATEKGP